jgi:hypothetical protein
LPRILDKCRGTIAGTNGDYNFNCPLDQEFFEFTQLDAEKFKAEVKSGKGDGEMLAWVRTNARKLTIVDAMAWSAYQDQRAPGQVEKQEFFNSLHKEIGPHRDDISTWFDLLDLDDHVSFGGKA